MATTKPKKSVRPRAGQEKTGGQPVGSSSGAVVLGVALAPPGYGRPSPATIDTYRRMRRNPTIALARAAATAPVVAAGWSYEADDGVQDERVEAVRAAMEPLRRRFVHDCLYALDYGFKPFEVVWEVREGLLAPSRVKGLSVERTEARVDDRTWALLGAKQDKVTLERPYFAWFVNDREDDNWYGRSRHENVRETAWAAWDALMKREGQYVQKVAGIIPMVEYPVGESEDETGAKVSNYVQAAKILANLGKGNGVALPNALVAYARELLNKGVPIDKVRAWTISFLEASGSHGSSFVEMARHKESLMMRGWLVPERAATEGQYGTKAEAAVHGDLAVTVAEQVSQDIADCANEQVVDEMLEANYGESARGTVRIVPAPLVDEKLELVKEIMKAALTSSTDVLTAWADVDAMLDMLGLPKSQEVVTDEPGADDGGAPGGTDGGGGGDAGVPGGEGGPGAGGEAGEA